jgi:hypothetical protein
VLTRAALRQNLMLQIPATLVTLGLMWLVPLLVHMIPPFGDGTPLGVRLLPIFYAPLLAVFLFHPTVAIVSSLVMPFINYQLTGMPPFNIAVLLTVELVVFTIAMLLARQRWPNLALAPAAVLLGKVSSALLLIVLPLLPAHPWDFFVQTSIESLPGILVLLALHLALIRWVPGQNSQ